MFDRCFNPYTFRTTVLILVRWEKKGTQNIAERWWWLRVHMFGHTIMGWSSVPQGDRDSRCSRWPPWRINSRRANCKHCENGRVCTSVLSFLREIFSFSFFFVIVFSTSLEIAIEALFKLESKHPLRAPIERLVYYRQIQRDTHGSLSQNRQTRESTTTMRTRVHTHSVPSPFRVSADVVDRFDSQAPVSKEKQHGIQRGRNNTGGFRGGR